jgi:hypothetical protein
MNEQTAIEWLVEQVNSDCLNSTFIRPELIRKAKAMEKDQMDKISEDWWVEGCAYMKDGKRIYESFEQYYNETYGGDK